MRRSLNRAWHDSDASACLSIGADTALSSGLPSSRTGRSDPAEKRLACVVVIFFTVEIIDVIIAIVVVVGVYAPANLPAGGAGAGAGAGERKRWREHQGWHGIPPHTRSRVPLGARARAHTW